MNALVHQTEFVACAEPRRHRFTFEELLAIQALGILGDGRIELVDGEILHMPADGDLHRSWTRELTAWFAQHLDFSRYALLTHTTLNSGKDWFPSPDFYVHLGEREESHVRSPDVLLLIEEADSSLKHDLENKARRYAESGIRDYWVIDLNTKQLHVHRDPTADGYQSVKVFERDQAIDALLISGLSLRLADLPRVG